MKIVEVLLLLVGVAGDPLMTILLNISHSRQFDTDTLHCSIKETGDCRRNSKDYRAQVVMENATATRLAEDSKVKETVFRKSFIKVLQKQASYSSGDGTTMLAPNNAKNDGSLQNHPSTPPSSKIIYRAVQKKLVELESFDVVSIDWGVCSSVLG